MGYERSGLIDVHGYVPGEQPRGPLTAKLNTNENPYPPHPAVLEALHGITGEALRRYPDPTATAFRAVAAAVHSVTPDHIIATNGGDELLRLAVTTFAGPGERIGVADPGYSLYPVLAAINGSPVCAVPLADDWSIPPDVADRWNDAAVRLAFLVNPHAPSGTLTPIDTIGRIAATFRGVLVIDEAYVDFVDPSLGHDAVALVRRLPNVLLLRTMSKGYSLAGLRFGYGIGSPELIRPMTTKTKDSYNIDAIAQALAEAALRHRDETSQAWAAVRSERRRLSDALTVRGFLCAPSQSNFLLARVPGGGTKTAARWLEDLAQRRIYVRWFDHERLRELLRITIGTPRENDALLTAIDGLRG
jgi:histidinol-phosphate aminotransferase